VQQLRTEMQRVADEYLNCATFWLHRSNHSPYTAGTAQLFRMTGAATLRVNHNAATSVLDANGAAVQCVAGELFPRLGQSGAWTHITHPQGAGWVPTSSGRMVLDDSANGVNHGTRGTSGVAYSYGCKDTPDVYSARLEANPLAPATNGAGSLLRIANWSEYTDGH